MEFRQLEAFTAVIRYRSFTKAAEELFLTQPTVSAHISSLEKEFGTKLILRTTKELSPTEAGEALYSYANKLLELRDAASSAVIKCLDSSESIRIAASTVPDIYHLPKLMVAFRAAHPEYTFDVIHGDSADVEAAVLSGRAELGLMGRKPNGRGMVSVPFAGDRLVVITPNTEKYRLIKKRFPFVMLVSEPFINREYGSGTRLELERFIERCGVSPSSLNLVYEADSTEAVKNLVSSGMGISMVSSSACLDYVEFGKILCFDPEPDTPKRSFFISKLRSAHLSSGAKLFFEFVRHNDFFHR